MVASAIRCAPWLLVALLTACSEPAQTPAPAPKPPLSPTFAPAQPAAPAPLEPPLPVAAPLPAAAEAVNAAAFTREGSSTTPGAAYDAVLLKAQILLDRARFSPGVLDGKSGSNLRQAIAAFEQARDLPVDGKLDDAVWEALATDAGPVLQTYVITAQDVAGPFLGDIPGDDYDALAKLPALGYERASEALAEKFHMDEALLLALNPGTEFAAGQSIVTAAAGMDRLDVGIASVEVDRTGRAVRAYGPDGALVAFYPASVGSKDFPAPSGAWAVRAVAKDPAYYYNPDRLTFGRDKASGKLEIKPGPNNPVGSTWIDLTRDTYGIHGAPHPETIGKQQSHGCVRLTNWDVAELATGVKAGVKVVFVGAEGSKAART